MDPQTLLNKWTKFMLLILDFETNGSKFPNFSLFLGGGTPGTQGSLMGQQHAREKHYHCAVSPPSPILLKLVVWGISLADVKCEALRRKYNENCRSYDRTKIIGEKKW